MLTVLTSGSATSIGTINKCILITASIRLIKFQCNPYIWHCNSLNNYELLAFVNTNFSMLFIKLASH